MVEADVTSNIEGSGLLYAPAVVGMSIARLLGWGTVPMLLFARYLNLIVFALFVWFGMRMLPFGKITLFVLALQSKMKKTIVFITHDLSEAIKLGDRIAIMRDGEVVPADLSREFLFKCLPNFNQFNFFVPSRGEVSQEL